MFVVGYILFFDKKKNAQISSKYIIVNFIFFKVCSFNTMIQVAFVSACPAYLPAIVSSYQPAVLILLVGLAEYLVSWPNGSLPSFTQACIPSCIHNYLPAWVSSCLCTFLRKGLPVWLDQDLHACLHAYLPAELPTFLSASLHICPPACMPACLSTSRLAGYLACLLVCLPVCLLACLPTW